ncbi:fimbrial protein [Escherichia coli]|uniref:Fimbrial protein n=1 Tax=Escherichia coli TaxID=562 RepID=A0A6L7C7B8_ECOLX|nr:fimbrial protein [Escherichia coli]MWR25313.1 fimbrial protein [Escherichia coli]MWS02433.1 fimbrial protein [Escherichia coli]MWS07370.1 fimbrial protein [Escherichia coli]MWS45222.1 fimbrial protein [Escherichia coli]MWS55654.1 fimbrial protein [Escherichia coli]
MKKTLIALAVAASAVSGMAHAWTNGDFNGSVDIGGSITADDYRQKWSWAVGSDINGFSNVLTDLTEGGTKLTITVNSDKPILLGKTNEAFSTSVIGGVGAIPVISFTGFDGAKVEPEFSTNGKVVMTLPVKTDQNSNKVGNLTVNATASGLLSYARPDTGAYKAALYAPTGTTIFTGGLTTDSSLAMAGQDSNNFTALMGSLDINALYQQVIQAMGGDHDLNADWSPVLSENMYYEDGTKAAASYALGIANGQTIEATFDQAVTASTQWSAPLNVAVTYN